MSATFTAGDRVRITDDASAYTEAVGKVGTVRGESSFPGALVVAGLEGFVSGDGYDTQAIQPEHLEAAE